MYAYQRALFLLGVTRPIIHILTETEVERFHFYKTGKWRTTFQNKKNTL